MARLSDYITLNEQQQLVSFQHFSLQNMHKERQARNLKSNSLVNQSKEKLTKETKWASTPMPCQFGFAWKGGIQNVLLSVTFSGKGRRGLRKRGSLVNSHRKRACLSHQNNSYFTIPRTPRI